MTLPLTVAELVVDVVGVPAPQGSKAFKGMRAGKPILVESSRKVAPWREAVERAARARIALTGWVTLDCPVRLDVVFLLPPPKTMPRGRTMPTTYPDLSKIVRSTEDALTSAGVWADDARVCDLRASKVYTTGRSGARITVRAL
jgi:Holliday junction resolvase RusA-like endonuclease